MNEVWCRQLVIKLVVILVHFIGACQGVSIRYDPSNNQNSNLEIPGIYPEIDRQLIQGPQTVHLDVPLYPYTYEPVDYTGYNNAQNENSHRIIPKIIIPAQQKQRITSGAKEEEKAEDENLSTEESKTPAQYDYGYSVSDPHTGDSKTQYETRRGDVVKGSYSVVDADGTKRTVEYTADSKNGFNAIVRKEKPDGKKVGTISQLSQVDVNQETIEPKVNYKKPSLKKIPGPVSYPPDFGLVRGKFVSIPDGRFREFIIPSPQLNSHTWTDEAKKITGSTLRRYPNGVKGHKRVYLNHLPLRVPTESANLRYFPIDIRGFKPVDSKPIIGEQNEVQNEREYHQSSHSKFVNNSGVPSSRPKYQPVFTKTKQDPSIVHTISPVNGYSSLPFRSYPIQTVTEVPQDVQTDILRAPSHVIHRFITIPVGYT